VDKNTVLTAEAERFERRLTEEISGLRTEMHDQIAALRTEMHDQIAALRTELHDGLASVRQEMHAMRVDTLKWSFLFWVGQVATMTALISFLLRAR
jgi:phage host-nuclease inhibitor protein Gam